MYTESKRADEVATMFASSEECLEDKKLFVKNMGDLLSQTRERIVGTYLTDDEIVVIERKGGVTEEINVKDNSYLATLREVINKM